MTRTGGRLLVDQLALHGTELAFGVPGESYLAVLDAMYEAGLRLVVCRHEGGAANMAEAYGKLTGRPGVCLVTRGPGATHASVGVHTAFQDSTPMLLLVGQVARGAMGREGFQELDYRHVFGGVAKWATQIDDAARIPEVMARAYAVAVSGRPGPVVVALPEDMLTDEEDAPDAVVSRPVAASPGAAELEELRALLAGARRPLVIVGEGGWTAQAGADIAAFAEANDLPVAASFRCQDYVDNRAQVYAGHAGLGMDPALARRIAEADVLLAVGGRLGEIPTNGYTLLEVPAPRQRLVHVHPDPDELGAVYEPELGIVSGLPAFAAAARALAPARNPARDGLVAEAHADYRRFLGDVRELPGSLQLGGVMAVLRERLGPEAILTCGAGNFTVWAHRYYEFSRYPAQLAPRSGSMGYGFPAAVAAKVLHPERTVVCLAGDGDFLMTGQELATAVAEELAVVVLVVNNGMYGTIRMHQERRYPGRVYATDLVNPDFAAYARSFGAHGALVDRTEDFADALEAALGCGGPALIELRVDPEAITPRQTIAEIRAATEGAGR
jgi:acetolactate synthase I/II/III large subunit